MLGQVAEALLKQRRLPLYLPEKIECYTTNNFTPLNQPLPLVLCNKNYILQSKLLETIHLCGLAKLTDRLIYRKGELSDLTFF